MYEYKITAMTGYRLSSCMYTPVTHLIGLSVRNNVFLLLYSASENIHHPLIETEEIMDLTVFAWYTVETTSVYEFCILFV